jgi:2-dehydropantoate 2-reductase
LTIAIWGAGAVGLVLGARLTRAGEDVVFVCRRAKSAREIAARGVGFEDLVSGEKFRVPARALSVDEVTAGDLGAATVLVCTRGPSLPEACEQLAALGGARDVACVTNGIDPEAAAARHFDRVVGVVYRQTCTRVEPGAAVSVGGGRAVVGAYPEGRSSAADAVAARLIDAGYDVGVSSRLAEDRWLKLCVNLMSSPNALIRRGDHQGQAFVEIKTRLLEEAQAVLAAAGLTARSCDGRDRSLTDEIEFQRTALERGQSGRALPLYNQVWSALRHGGPLEADAYHREILERAAHHGISAPMNRQVLDTLERTARQELGPEREVAEDLLAGAT